MPIYDYKGLNQKGTGVKGRIDGDSVKTARAKLRLQGVFPTEIYEQTAAQPQKKKGVLKMQVGGRIKSLDLATMTKQFSTLVSAHIPIVEALSALSKQVENEKLKVVLTDLKEKVNEGQSLAKAMSAHPKVFSDIYMNMVKAGEASGTLHIVMERLANFTEAQTKLKNKLITAMLYPIIMIVVAIIMCVVIFTFILPSLMELFEGTEVTLPTMTVVSIGVAQFIIGNWYLFIGGFIIFIMLFLQYIKTPTGKRRYHGFLLRAPVFGKLVQMIAVSRFARTLGTLLQSGVPLLMSMDIVKHIVNNVLIMEALEKAKIAISEGKSIATPLEESGYFPPMVTHMVAVGEKTGELESMLATISNTYDSEVETQIEALTSVLTPIMTIFMAGIVFYLMVAIILPAMDMMTKIV